MKYSKSNPPLVCMMTHSSCYKGTTTMQVKGVLWHSTGANNPTLKRYVQPYEGEPNYDEMIALLGYNKNKNDWNHKSVQAGLNCWIGKLADGSVTTVQTMPWNYRPWGCGSGKNGSCNDGWIQFEICEDALTDKNYFNTIYKEACEITAYLCEMYNIDPQGTVEYNGIEVPTIICHRDSYDFGLGSGHADIYHWFSKYGKDIETIRNDVAALMNKITPIPQPTPTPEKPQLYRIRKSWTDSKSQIGAYSDLNNAIAACKKAGPEYHVYNIEGEEVYPNELIVPVLEVGEVCRVKPGAKWVNGTSVPTWVINSKMYLREIRKNGDYVISTVPTGPVTGVINPQYVYEEEVQEYQAEITTAALNVRAAASANSTKLGTLYRGNRVKILQESNGWGKIIYKNRTAWISLLYTKKV